MLGQLYMQPNYRSYIPRGSETRSMLTMLTWNLKGRRQICFRHSVTTAAAVPVRTNLKKMRINTKSNKCSAHARSYKWHASTPYSNKTGIHSQSIKLYNSDFPNYHHWPHNNSNKHAKRRSWPKSFRPTV